MKNYIYEPMWSQELEDAIENDKAKSLIMEMFYKHGLRVYDMSSANKIVGGIHEDGYIQEQSKIHHRYMMTLDGLPYCQVWVNELADNKVQYCFYSPYYEKERGRDQEDKRTIRSAKISGLVRMLDRYGCVVDSPERVLNADAVKNVAANTYYHYVKKGKEANGSQMKPSYPNNMQYDVLEAYMTGTKLTQEKNAEIKKLFDIWTKEVETERHALDKVKSLYGTEFYMLVETGTRGICVGKGRLNVKDDAYKGEFEITDSFQRVESLDSLEGYDDLKGALTMYKVYAEGAGRVRRPRHQVLQDYSGYVEDLSMFQTTLNWSRDAFGIDLLVIPMAA